MSIARGLVYLHTFVPTIIHRDLKSRNALPDSKKGTKLIDFGTSREEVDTDMNCGIGTFQWMAPEVIVGTEYTIAAGIYSFGAVFEPKHYFLTNHSVLYSDAKNPSTGRLYPQQSIMTMVTVGEIRPKFNYHDTLTWVHEFGKQCMASNSLDRPTTLSITAILQRVKTE
ncbi:kinase [Thraustotheca clavata]|uniref:Kinase n=1 Tax=Thraustotheca clavata TaxID=74557 RepID=A0A1V9ZVK5_9STRA|nr:kinase [Thraustotheca clavata]